MSDERPSELGPDSAAAACVPLDDIPLPALIYDLETLRYLAVNRAALVQYGYTRAELLAMTVPDLRPPEDVPKLMEALRSNVPGATRLGVVVRHRRRDGSVFHAEITSHSTTYAGRAARIVTACDVTDRLRAEEAVRESEQKLGEAQRLARIVGWERSIDTGETRLSPELLRMLGLPDDARFESTAALIHPDDLPRVLAAGAELRRTSVPISCELRYVLAGGTLHALLRAGVRQAADGTRSILGTLQDVTEQRRWEAALRESEERFRTAFQTMPDAVTITSLPEGRYVAINLGFTRMTGWAEAEAVGKTSAELGIWVDPAARQRAVEELEREGSLRELRARYRRRDGSELDADFSARTLVVGGERFMISVTRDVTAQVQAAEERARLQDQLRQSQKMEAVGKLAGGVAHDFNNMMTVVTNFAGFQLDEAAPGSQLHEDLQQIRKAAERATGLTRQLLAFSRKQLMQPRQVNLNLLVAELQGMLPPLLGERVELRLQLAPTLQVVRVDPGQLGQVIVNLAVNAHDAMPGGGTLTIATRDVSLDPAAAAAHPEMPAGSYVLLSVTDTGVGMDAETRQRAFEPFFTTKGGRGTGLGLSTVYGIVKQCGGYIWIESEPGHGATFRVYLPALAGEHVEEPRPAPPGAAAGTGHETILVVEDEELVRETVRTALVRAGYHVLAAAGGAQALQVFEAAQGCVDLLLTDVVMPRFDGTEVARQLREFKPGLRVIFMSGYTDNAVLHHGVVDGGLDLLEKPFTQAALTALIRDVLARPPR